MMDLMERFSDNFELWEFVTSSDHPGVAERMRFRPYQKQRLVLLCNLILQPLREHFGQVDILSGKRTVTLNRLVGGSVDSDHIHCIAVDINLPGADLFEIYDFIVEKLPFREVFLHAKEGYIHVSINIPSREWKKIEGIL